MDRQKKLALFLCQTPFHGVARVLWRKLNRYMEVAENWNNGDEATNGEAFLLRRAAPHLRVAFDIGANLGNWSALLIAENPRCEVHAFEASPLTFPNLQKRLDAQAGVHLHPAGMGERPGTLAFHDYGENSGLSSFVSRESSVGQKPERIIDVPVTTVDAFCAENRIEQIDFIKVDTEGYEMAVLRGMAAMLERRRIALVQFEYGGTWIDMRETLARANDFLARHRYEFYRLRQRGLERFHYDCWRHECFKYANFVAAESVDVLRRWQIPIVEP